MACLLVAAAVVSISLPASQADAAAPWTNTADRDAVIANYQAEFGKSVPSSGWTGNRSSCNAGTTSQSYRNAIFDRINWFRGMAGVPTGVTENAGYTAKAQDAALMMSVEGRLDHNPTSGWACYTSAGDAAAGSSNLYLGQTGPDAITGYVNDPGQYNYRVGHRSWILHPTSRQMGTGDIPASGGGSANALWVFDDYTFGAQPALRESDGFVAWPPRGYVPGEVVFPRWSFSIRGADFAQASATVQRVQSGGSLQSVSSSVVYRSSGGGAPFPVIVWEPSGIDTSPAVDATYRVTISGVKVGGATKSYAYETIVVGDEPGVVTNVDYTAYVRNAFNDFLGRNPTSAELADWDRKLNSGTTRFTFVSTLADSDEWTAFIVDQMYVDTLGRAADGAGRSYWISQLQVGLSVAEVAAQFYGSPEYIANEGNTFEAWLEDLYGELLYREPDGSGLDYWLGQAEVSGSTSVAFTFYQSEESRMARVNDLFDRLLDRAPDAAGHRYWAGVLLNGDDISLAASLAASAEYLDQS